jgi:non-specific serine/threonine protein kinase/serine/threonine-protein kinase
MAEPRRKLVEDYFHGALDLLPEERARFLADHLGHDGDLRRQVEALLHHYENGKFASLLALEKEEQGGVVGERIGRYQLVELIGEGGMGSVYVAEQDEPVRRRVALKIIKHGMDSRQVIVRFEAERQALALMDHPHIARVLDAGTTESGRPYFVMELVRGVPVTEFCDERRVSLADRLSLFVRVCQAVQHAHHKGIIHRDLKPSNILVTALDGVPIPKVIDFGVAKITNRELAPPFRATEIGQAVGTPDYMSPEQLDTNGGDVDSRADVYALGCLLYELIVGRTPAERGQSDRSPQARRVRNPEVDVVPAPSRRLKRLGKELGAVAAARDTTPHALIRRVQGDLDWIVVKALDPDRERRYPTAASLAEDVRRHLNLEPVAAGPPGAAYRLRKFIQRHRSGVLVTGIVVISLTLGLVFALLGFFDAERARRSLERERDVARASADRAIRESNRTGMLNTFLLQMLESVNPNFAPKPDVTVRSLLDEAIRKLDRGGLTGHPDLEASVRLTVGRTYLVLGWLEEARVQVERALTGYARVLGPDAADTQHARFTLGEVLLRQGQIKRAEHAFRRLAAAKERTLGRDHPETLAVRGRLVRILIRKGHYRLGVRVGRALLETQNRVLGEKNSESFYTINSLSLALSKLGRHAEAKTLLTRVARAWRAAWGETALPTLLAQVNLGGVLIRTGELGRAEALLETTHEMLVRRLGREHPTTLNAAYELAYLYRRVRRWREAAEILETLLASQRRLLGVAHPRTRGTTFELGRVCWAMGDEERCRDLFERAIEEQGRLAARPDADSQFLHDYARLLLTSRPARLRDPERAARLARRALVRDGDPNPAVLGTLAAAYHQLGDLDRAIAAQERAVRCAPGGERGRLSGPEKKLLQWQWRAGGFMGVLRAWCSILRSRGENDDGVVRAIPEDSTGRDRH